MKSVFPLWFWGCCLIPSLVLGQPIHSERSGNVSFKIDEVATGLGITWGMVFIDPETLLLTQRDGRLILLNTQTGVKTSVGGAPQVLAQGQGGLLDVAVAPNYKPGGWLYFTYSKPVNGLGATTLARARLQGQQLTNWRDLLVSRSTTDTTRHYGSRIAFDDAGHIFFTIGDRGERPNGQDLKTHAGSVLRLNLDGSTPTDNPFSGHPDALPEIWSYGHRNPQGIVFDRKRQRLWIIEHGPRGGDELNLIQPGRNYGWPVISYGKEYWGPFQVGEGTAKAGMEQPVKYYVPSIAPGSLIQYSGKAISGWRDNLLAGALVLEHLNRIVISEAAQAVAEERLLKALDERIRALVEGPEGSIYLSTDSGRILHLYPE